jgi:hypothetical protein
MAQACYFEGTPHITLVTLVQSTKQEARQPSQFSKPTNRHE